MHGEVVLLADPDAALAWLDAYEGYVHGGGDATNTTALVREVRLAGGETFDAWVYLLRRAPRMQRGASTAAAGSAADARVHESVKMLRAGLRPERPSPRRHGPRLDRGGQLPHVRSYTRHGAATIGAGKNKYSCANRADVTCCEIRRANCSAYASAASDASALRGFVRL